MLLAISTVHIPPRGMYLSVSSGYLCPFMCLQLKLQP